MDLVRRADELGYHRYWFAEHHATASFASASPAVMMAHAAALTQRIRLGSGGVLMGHARALEVAETFRTLQALAPGRIDLGVGRAPGGDQRVMNALGYDPKGAVERVREVMQMLADQRVASNSGNAVAVPDQTSPPEIWMLGTSVDSASTAGALGLPYAFGSFIDPTNITAALTAYHQSFMASAFCDAPKTMVATVAFCGETDAEARRIMQCSEQWFVQSFLRGQNIRFPASGEPLDVTAQERVITAFRRETVIHGAPASCRQQLEHLRQATRCDEIAIVTITERYEDRVRSYELLAPTTHPAS